MLDRGSQGTFGQLVGSRWDSLSETERFVLLKGHPHENNVGLFCYYAVPRGTFRMFSPLVDGTNDFSPINLIPDFLIHTE